MNTKNELSRITIDVPTQVHKKLKSMAALEGKSMRQIVVDLIDESLLSHQGTMKRCSHGHRPNAETVQVIKEVRAGKNVVKAKNVRAIFKKIE